MTNRNTGIIHTLTARCRDCYRCLRVCPVNAIGVRNGQAYIDDDKCIHCGTCIRECPQKAKTYRRDLDRVREMLAGKSLCAVSIAPSFAAAYPDWKATRIPSALRRLGFDFVSETSDGAALTAKATVNKAKQMGCGDICTACPAVVNYTEKYMPDMVGRLIKIVSPMIAHARLIKKKRGNDCRVVFIGPCVAKKGEAERHEHDGAVDAVITFEELDEWMEIEKIDMRSLPESGFESYGDSSEARLFPIPGGMLKTAGVANDGTGVDIIHTSGAENISEMFSLPESNRGLSIIEPLFCREGCINGPAMNSEENIYKRRNDVIRYAEKRRTEIIETKTESISLYTEFKSRRPHPVIEFKETDIQEVFSRTGKSSSEYQLNCGACGFTSCRRMAEAVLEGKAETEMCMPYMRRLAECKQDMIIEASPDGIVVLDRKFNIVSMNTAFRKIFLCSDSVIGREISYLMDDVGFEKVASGNIAKYESIVRFNAGEYHQTVYKIEEDSHYVGIFSDISGIRINEKMLEGLRKETAEKAEELLKHQLEMAEKMAMFLGESTARSEELLEKLMGGTDD